MAKKEKRLPLVHPGEILRENFLVPLNLSTTLASKKFSEHFLSIHTHSN